MSRPSSQFKPIKFAETFTDHNLPAYRRGGRVVVGKEPMKLENRGLSNHTCMLCFISAQIDWKLYFGKGRSKRIQTSLASRRGIRLDAES